MAEWRVETTVEIDSCHWLELDYPSQCSQQHGHRWQVTVKCSADSLTSAGMVVDFTQVKDIIRRWDHTAFNLMSPFNMINPTAENLAEYWCRTVNEHIGAASNRPWCYEVDVEETPGNRAVYLAERAQPAGAPRERSAGNRVTA
jgi:6-pyruvoyltetrahydropterin/6-carboxytetrahydropterin synthase